MKTMLTIALILAATAAQAGTIHDIRTGLVPVGTELTIIDAVVTAVMDNSIVVSEQATGPELAVWVYGGEAPTVSAGDVVTVSGTYLELNGRATISLLYPADAGVTVTGSAPVPVNHVTVFQLQDDPEGWETTLVNVTDGLIVQEILENGQWSVASYETGYMMVLDDYFHLFPAVRVAECYNNADGLFFFYGGAYVLKALHVEYVDCTVADEPLSFGAVKALYR
jgi:hypothetical protein